MYYIYIYNTMQILTTNKCVKEIKLIEYIEEINGMNGNRGKE